MIQMTRRACEARQARFLLVFLPDRNECFGGRKRVDISRFDYLDLKAQFPARREEWQRLCLGDDPHFSAAGHHLVGQILYKELLRRGWVTGASEL